MKTTRKEKIVPLAGKEIAGYVLGGVMFVVMLTGTLCYLAGFIVWLWTWQALLVWGIFFVIMFVQVLTEEHRLQKDFGEEYEAYCKRTRRF